MMGVTNSTHHIEIIRIQSPFNQRSIKRKSASPFSILVSATILVVYLQNLFYVATTFAANSAAQHLQDFAP
jgi:hypothetical protein